MYHELEVKVRMYDIMHTGRIPGTAVQSKSTAAVLLCVTWQLAPNDGRQYALPAG